MIIHSKNFSLKLEEIPKEETLDSSFSETELCVIRLANKWLNGDKSFKFETSGSTGKSKSIEVSRRQIEYSILSTFSFIDPGSRIKSALLCLNPNFIGGAMVVFRALSKGLDLTILEPTGDLISSLPSTFQVDLVSLVPLQFDQIPNEELHRFGTILIGGAPLLSSRAITSPLIFSTYGMTETVSHVALRRINEDYFTCTGDTVVQANEDQCLQFKGSIVNDQWLTTNDIGEVITPTTFKWIGRSDFIINSGGIKINPELLENKLANQLSDLFMVSSIPDPQLGEKVVLLVEGKKPKLDFSALEKYEKPRMIVDHAKINRTKSGKLDRFTTREELIASLST